MRLKSQKIFWKKSEILRLNLEMFQKKIYTYIQLKKSFEVENVKFLEKLKKKFFFFNFQVFFQNISEIDLKFSTFFLAIFLLLKLKFLLKGFTDLPEMCKTHKHKGPIQNISL